MKALVFDHPEFQVAHLDVCLVLRGKILPLEIPLCCAGCEWDIGTRFLKLGSKKSSAGYVTLRFDSYEPLRYAGYFSGRHSDGEVHEYSLFKQGDKPEGGFFAYHPTSFGLVFGTNTAAARVISMDDCEVLE